MRQVLREKNKMCFVQCISVLTLMLLFTIVESYDKCKVPRGGLGYCIPLKECKPLYDLEKRNDKTDNDLLFLRQASCGSNYIYPKICCPPKSEWDRMRLSPINRVTPVTVTAATTDLQDKADLTVTRRTVPLGQPQCDNSLKPPNRECCGIDTSGDNRIFGGKIANVDQYPWLALLEYQGSLLLCGGSLISSRYVLTAGHCIKTRYGEPIIVRLSEFNITTDPFDIVETEGGGLENVTVTKISVERTVVHPNFTNMANDVFATKSLINDIALIKMSRNAEYTDFIRPICLPTKDYTATLKLNTKLFTAGWGAVENLTNHNSEVKRFVDLPYIPLDKCRIVRSTITSKQICAGGEEHKDSCNGDSGGPLMLEDKGNGSAADKRFIAFGVVSYGRSACGTLGSPSVNTNVYEYVEWIVDSMV